MKTGEEKGRNSGETEVGRKKRRKARKQIPHMRSG